MLAKNCLVLFLVTFPLAFLYFLLSDIDNKSIYSVVSLCAFFHALLFINSFFIQSSKRVNASLFFNSILVPLLISVLILVTDLKVVNIFLYSIFASLAFSYFFVKNTVFQSKCNYSYYNKNKGEIKFFACITMLNVCLQWLPVSLAGFILDSNFVAGISVSLRLAMVSTFFLIAINALMVPSYSREFKLKRTDKVQDLLNKSSLILFIFTTPVFVLFFIYGEFWLSLFGEDYVSYANCFRILLISQYVSVLCGSVGYLLQLSGHYKLFLVSLFLSILIMIFSTAGVALISESYTPEMFSFGISIAIIFHNLFCCIFVKRDLNLITVPFLGKLLRPVGSDFAGS
ncbi:MATE family efflux transporter [Alteromonas sp. KUL49]|uniref:MATE family efflux transporter n=1 Tax=Alteromonas sp. KUL49 TaxID=2480798 RepID=UPI0026A73577